MGRRSVRRATQQHASSPTRRCTRRLSMAHRKEAVATSTREAGKSPIWRFRTVRICDGAWLAVYAVWAGQDDRTSRRGSRFRFPGALSHAPASLWLLLREPRRGHSVIAALTRASVNTTHCAVHRAERRAVRQNGRCRAPPAVTLAYQNPSYQPPHAAHCDHRRCRRRARA